jgi:hypothetical protein
MKRLIFAFALIGAGIGGHAAHAAAPAECFATSGAVFSAHPNATHASYTSHVKKSGRCWYADAFRTEAKPEPRPGATVARTTSEPRHAITAPQPRTTEAAPAPQPRTMAVAPTPRPRTTTAVAPKPRPLAVEFATEIPPAIARGFSRLSPVDESPTDFEGRFSVTGYKVPK